MNETMLLSQRYTKGIPLDPRTKLAVLLTLSVLVFGGSYQTTLFYLPAILPLVIAFCVKSYKKAAVYIVAMVVCLLVQAFIVPFTTGTIRFIMTPLVIMPLYFIPGFFSAYFLLTTTTVSEFVASMEKLKLPKQVTIPMAVMFRFFPTIFEEWKSINDAMRMRSIRFNGSKAGAMLEYRIVPMLMCSVKIGEELSCASLTRGLGGPVKRTNTCEIKFKLQDFFILIVCTGFLAVQALIFLGVLG